jgi:hypothetical protein
LSLAGPGVSLGYSVFAGAAIAGTALVVSVIPPDYSASWLVYGLAYCALAFGVLMLFATWFAALIGSDSGSIWEPAMCFLISGGALYGAAGWFAGTPYDWLSGICTWAFRLTAGLAVLLTILRIASLIFEFCTDREKT